MDSIKKALLLLIISLLSLPIDGFTQRYGLVIHGGAGSMNKESMTEDRALAYENALKMALEIGYNLLENGATAEEAVIATIKQMEDDSLFNCGRGSVLNAKAEVEMDASIMLGQTLDAGAVAGVRTIRNPIEAAALVMRSSPHVLMSNDGADQFAKKNGLQTEPTSYFMTQKSYKTLKRVQERRKDQGYIESQEHPDEKYGTVGCVALDQHGNLAAGTSTGGMTDKMFNRIGDSPIIGAGTYANNKGCAVSCTGHGEYFIRLSVAHEVSALMIHKGYDIDKAARFVIHEELEELGGKGGLIAIDRRGNISMPFNTSGMFRAFKRSDGTHDVKVFSD